MRLIPFILCIAFILAGCSKGSGPGGGEGDPPPVHNGTPAITAKGEPDGSAPARKSIGAAGGTLTSIDGKLTLTVPLGAFTADQQVSIQRIGNLNPAAAGHAYRLLPEGVTFAKPVSITFRCEDTDSTFFAPEYLAGSYQKANGAWMVLRGTVDALARTVTVQTTHFSDWSAVSNLALKIEQPALAPMGRSGLTVFHNAPDAPMQGDEMQLYLPVMVKSQYIQQWKIVSGAGKLMTRTFKENPIEFEAPNRVPDPPNDLTTIAVTVQPDPRRPATVTLRGKIRTVEGAMLLKINDGVDIELIASYAVKDDLGYWSLEGRSKDWKTTVVMKWPNGVGNHAFSVDPRLNNPSITVNYNGATYGYFYETDEGLLPSPGGINCTSVGDEDGYVRGDFTVGKAGNALNLRRTVRIEGSFMTPKMKTEIR